MNIYCGKCDQLMEFQNITDDLSGNLREYYRCPSCGNEVYIIIATVRDDE